MPPGREGGPDPGAASSPPSAAGPPFGDRLAAAVAARESQIVLGLDPDPARLWPDALEATGAARAGLAEALATTWAAAELPRADPSAGGALAGAAWEAAAAVLAHCRALIDAAGPACVAAKPQLATFERLGFAGWLALEATCAHARAAGLLVLADGKRGDVPVSASAYAQALAGATPTPFGAVTGLAADAFTASPLLGEDALAPLLTGAREARAGLFVLVRTSNPGARDVLDLPLASGGPLWESFAGLVAGLGRPGSSGLADVGAVTGATAPEHLERMRALMPAAPFLLPGVGAQGGAVERLAPAFAPGRAAGLVTASRSIADAGWEARAAFGGAARAAAEGLRARTWGLV